MYLIGVRPTLTPMTTKLWIAMQNSVLTLESSKNSWNMHESLKGTHPQGISFDPIKPNRAYCGTFGNGLMKTDDGGKTWANLGKEVISSNNIMSVALSHHNLERTKNNNEGFNTVYVGTEPTVSY